MGVVNRPGDRFDVIGGTPGRERAIAENHLAEAAPLDQPHREEEQAVGLADIIERDDVVMLEPAEDFRLGSKAFLRLVNGHLGRVAAPVGLDQLEGDQSVGFALK